MTQFSKLSLALVCVSLQMASAAARADEFLGLILDRSAGNHALATTAGIGAIEAPHVSDPSDKRDHSHSAWYGQGQVRIEAGLGVPGVAGQFGAGVNGDVTAGRELVDVRKPRLFGLPVGLGGEGAGLALHAGYEGSTHFNVNSNDERSDYAELGALGSLGLQASLGSCHALAAARAGLSGGTLGDGGLRPAKGFEASLVCKGMKTAGEWTRIGGSGSDETADLGAFDFKLVKHGTYINQFMGVRGEMINTRHDRAIPENTGADKNEVRILVSAGAAIL